MRGLTIDLDSEVPVYRQIADALRGLAAKGALPAGTELPSVRDLGARVGAHPNTVAKAYRILADEGLVELRHGSGARVRSHRTEYRDATKDDDEHRRLRDLISRWVGRGASRAVVERRIARVLEHFFEGNDPEPAVTGKRTA